MPRVRCFLPLHLGYRLTWGSCDKKRGVLAGYNVGSSHAKTWRPRGIYRGDLAVKKSHAILLSIFGDGANVNRNIYFILENIIHSKIAKKDV